MRKKYENIRKKIKIGQKPKKLVYASRSQVYGLPSPKNEPIANLIYNIYGNESEEILNKNYEEFIAQKSKINKTEKVVPRFISPKVEEMKIKEENRKANIFDNYTEKPLYKLKMFQDIGSKVAENIRKFRSFKPLMQKNINKSQEFDLNGVDKLIEKLQNDIEQK